MNLELVDFNQIQIINDCILYKNNPLIITFKYNIIHTDENYVYIELFEELKEFHSKLIEKLNYKGFLKNNIKRIFVNEKYQSVFQINNCDKQNGNCDKQNAFVCVSGITVLKKVYTINYNFIDQGIEQPPLETPLEPEEFDDEDVYEILNQIKN